MPIQQNTPIVPPDRGDTGLEGYTTNIQDNMSILYDAGHTHPIRTTFPRANEGNVGDIVGVNINSLYYLVVKISNTQWARTDALTLI